MRDSVIVINPAWTIEEMIARAPRTLAVFERFAIDTCCGGGVSIADAARRDREDLDALLSALRAAIEQP